MSRCNRHFDKKSQPYREFSFEKSLRNYEVLPHKKIKLNSSSIDKQINQRQENQPKLELNSPKNKTEHKELLSSEKLNSEMKVFQLKCNQMMNVQNTQEKQKHQQLQIFENDLPMAHLALAIAQNQQKEKENHELNYDGGQNMGQLEVKQSQQKFNLQQKQIKPEMLNQYLDGSILAQKIISNNSQLIVNFPKEQKSSTETHSRIAEGRFHLTDNISISLRNIAKYKGRGWTDLEILAKLFSQRKYLQVEKVQVAQKLRDYLHFS